MSQPIKTSSDNPEKHRLAQDARREKNWKRWGPYLSERQWGTVREDYSSNGDNWTYLTHEKSRSQSYRWGEDGLLGITDRQCRLSFALALWNGQDDFLKERLFGVTGREGNHGEDVKEEYYYLESTPTHSYMKALYKYPQQKFPYARLVSENQKRSKTELEYELVDSGVFNDNRYFDVQAEYAKSSPNDILIRITVFNRGPVAAPLSCLPTFWCRNTWSHGRSGEGYWPRPTISKSGDGHIVCEQASLGKYHFLVDQGPGQAEPQLIFTQNETNFEKLYGVPNEQSYVKDAFHEFIVDGKPKAIDPAQTGTKSAAVYQLNIEPGESVTLNMRIVCDEDFAKLKVNRDARCGEDFEQVFADRLKEADQFYDEVLSTVEAGQARTVARQAYAGLLWTKQFYFFSVRDWLRGDPNRPAPPSQRKQGRNSDWSHLYNRDVISMPDKLSLIHI